MLFSYATSIMNYKVYFRDIQTIGWPRWNKLSVKNVIRSPSCNSNDTICVIFNSLLNIQLWLITTDQIDCI